MSTCVSVTDMFSLFRDGYESFTDDLHRAVSQPLTGK